MLRHQYYAYYIIFPILSALVFGEGVSTQDIPVCRLTGLVVKIPSRTLGFGLE